MEQPRPGHHISHGRSLSRCRLENAKNDYRHCLIDSSQLYQARLALNEAADARPACLALVAAALQQHGLVLVLLTWIATVHVSFPSSSTSFQSLCLARPR
jgi:hypothetical protein